MSVSPLPRHGGVHFDARNEGRALRVSARAGEVVLSVWRSDECLATHHVVAGDVPELMKMLAAALVDSIPVQRPHAS
jgi:hypothetical protein